MENRNIHAITKTENTISNRIATSVDVKNVFTEKIIQTQGIWDTGATGSVITKSTASALSLQSIGKRKVRGVHGIREVNIYFVNITLDNKKITLNTKVTECEELSPDNSIGMLIGMNIISMGDFSITTPKGKTKFSFQIPSTHDIDFVRELNKNS
jgi:hypothetical protein